jgi:predicted nucleic acid-binding protein
LTDLLLDTDAVSILFKPAYPLYGQACRIVSGNHVLISFMTLAELSLWPHRNNWGATRRALFPDEATCGQWAEISAESFAAGRPMGTADAWIAATARQWGLPLATGNYMIVL